jgi:hypothetical protein
MTKESLKELVQQMPDHFSLEDLLDRIILLSKIESGLAQSKSKEVISTPELREKLKKWLS